MRMILYCSLIWSAFNVSACSEDGTVDSERVAVNSAPTPPGVRTAVTSENESSRNRQDVAWSDRKICFKKEGWLLPPPGGKLISDGHVAINEGEASAVKTDIEAVLRSNSSVNFTAKSVEAGLSEAKNRLNVSKVDAAISTGLARHGQRQGTYDRVGDHRLNPAQLKEKGIKY